MLFFAIAEYKKECFTFDKTFTFPLVLPIKQSYPLSYPQK